MNTTAIKLLLIHFFFFTRKQGEQNIKLLRLKNWILILLLLMSSLFSNIRLTDKEGDDLVECKSLLRS